MRSENPGRARLVGCFSVLLLALVASTPVLGAEGDLRPATVAPPGAAELAEAREAAEAEEEKRQRELRSPASRQARLASRSAYAELSLVGSRDLLSETFAVALASLDSDPGRLLSEVKLLRAFDETAARIESGGTRTLLESTVPVRTETEDGALKKVDLGLVEAPGGFEPANPLVDVRIPDTSGEPIAIGKEGLAVVPRGAEQGGQVLDADLVEAP